MAKKLPRLKPRVRMHGRPCKDEIDSLDALLAESVELDETTNNDNVLLGSIRTRLEILQRRRDLRRDYGLQYASGGFDPDVRCP